MVVKSFYLIDWWKQYFINNPVVNIKTYLNFLIIDFDKKTQMIKLIKENKVVFHRFRLILNNKEVWYDKQIYSILLEDLFDYVELNTKYTQINELNQNTINLIKSEFKDIPPTYLIKWNEKYDRQEIINCNERNNNIIHKSKIYW